ncbi:MAG: SDR family NAD(P)-dependent oxidoreductase [Pseudooceanicola sp.]|nr:SDR family NAD(P)-dependent oxidoreductase [Pseudooceanicola sp.]
MKTWMITGGTRGFGAAVAREALARGDRVAITGRDKAACAAISDSDRALPVALDMTKAEDIARAVAEVQDWAGGIDVLFNNAGRGHHGAIEEVSDAEAKALFELNVFGLLDLTRQVLPGMRAARKGHIINVGSIAGMTGNPGSGIYSATKFAVAGITEAMAAELAPLGIGVTLLAPGPFRTDFNGGSLTRSAAVIDDYAGTAHKRIAALRETDGQQKGDPLKLATLVCDIAGTDSPPLHLFVGSPAVDRARAKLAEIAQDIDAWEGQSRATDY